PSTPPMSPACRMWLAPAKASSTSGRKNPWVSETAPMRSTAIYVSSLQRIVPTEGRETGESGVGRAEHEPMLDGERCEMGIGDVVRPQAACTDQRTENFRMASGRRRDESRFARK